MEEGNNVGANATTETGANNATETKLSFDELLQDKEYQSAFDKKIAQSLQTAKTKWEQEQQSKLAESEKLASMNEKQKNEYELNKERTEKEKALAELNAYKLKDQAKTMASEKGVDISLLDLIDFKTVTAEKLTENIDNLSAVFTKAVEKTVNDRLKESTPKTVINDTKPKKSVSRISI